MIGEQFLRGKTALVTGSSRNLGAAIARSMAAKGARVIVTHRDSAPQAESLIAELESLNDVGHRIVSGDISTGATHLVEEAMDHSGHIDVLVNNAGPFSMVPFADLPETEWDRIWNTNLKASYLATKAVVPGMRGRGWGRIINLSAGSAYLRNHSIYTLAKASLITFTEELAVELGPEITVNCVAPGQIAESAADIAEFDPDFAQKAIEATPLQRLVTRSEVAEIITELCGPRFDAVTGVTIPIDGGWHLPRF